MRYMIESNNAVNVEIDGLLFVSNTNRATVWATCTLLDRFSNIHTTGYSTCDLDAMYVFGSPHAIQILRVSPIFEDLFTLGALIRHRGWKPIPEAYWQDIFAIIRDKLY
jgi:hypothetical protein